MTASKRRWSFSLRTLFVAVTVLCIAIALCMRVTWLENMARFHDRQCSLVRDQYYNRVPLSTIYEREFGSGFHQAKMKKLARLGLLRENDSTRGGNRRYYTLA